MDIWPASSEVSKKGFLKNKKSSRRSGPDPFAYMVALDMQRRGTILI